MTLEAFAEEWRSTIAVNLKDSTVRAAESHLRAHILPKLGKVLLPEINTRIGQSFVTSLALQGLSRKTVENIEYLADAVFLASNGKGLGLRDREYFALRSDATTRRNKKRAALFHGRGNRARHFRCA
jgi:hypothetical protein